jgi:CheY-like chemotaxis protein
MNGTISVESEKGVGTEFDVTVTLKNSGNMGQNTVRSIDSESIFVLVVDDNPIEAEHARMVLEEAGIRADACTSGPEALRKLEVQHTKLDPYNFVLTDWLMPGMNGAETAAEIKKIYADECEVVALTANNWDDIVHEANAVGVYCYMAKPLFSSNIMDKFEQIAQRSKLDIFKEKQLAKLSGRRILLAEDVDINAEIMMDSLEIENIKVDHAVNGKEAVELFEKSTAGIYSAILMDVRMPEMDGLEATKVIRAMEREDAKRIPIVALTANTFDEDVQLSIQAGMNVHLTKPVDSEVLLRVLGEIIYEAENNM